MFGFSRGAYTFRSLAGFISRVELIHEDNIFYLPELYGFYKSGAEEDVIAAFFQEKNLERYKPRIKMIGVFDKVGALGIPFGGINKLKDHAVDPGSSYVLWFPIRTRCPVLNEAATRTYLVCHCVQLSQPSRFADSFDKLHLVAPGVNCIAQ